MKTIRTLLMVGLLISISTMASAQHTYAMWSGYTHQYVPRGVHRTINGYRGYRWVATERFHDGRGLTFDVTLRKGNRVIELTMDRHGRVLSRNVHRYLPRKFHENGRYYSNVYSQHRSVRWNRPIFQYDNSRNGHAPGNNGYGRPRHSRWN